MDHSMRKIFDVAPVSRHENLTEKILNYYLFLPLLEMGIDESHDHSCFDDLLIISNEASNDLGGGSISIYYLLG